MEIAIEITITELLLKPQNHNHLVIFHHQKQDHNHTVTINYHVDQVLRFSCQGLHFQHPSQGEKKTIFRSNNWMINYHALYGPNWYDKLFFYKTLGGTWISHPWWIQVYNQCDLNIHCINFYLYAFEFPYDIRIWHTLWPADLSTDLRMGLSGRTTWPQHWRIVDCTSHLTAVEKVDIFALWVAHRSGDLKSQGQMELCLFGGKKYLVINRAVFRSIQRSLKTMGWVVPPPRMPVTTRITLL